MQFKRSGGILLHPSSLAGPFGIGDLGPEAHRFVEWLGETGSKLWQVLPLGPTGYGNSPYQCHSVFAGNPYLVSPEYLLRDGLLQQADLSSLPASPRGGRAEGRVKFGQVIRWKTSLLRRAFERFQEDDPKELREAFAVFRAENAFWLEDYALFRALKDANKGRSWVQWPDALRRREPAAMATVRESLGPSVLRHAFDQLLFFRQWQELRQHARSAGIQVIGDMPIFAAEDSSDVWAHPELFCMGEDGLPAVVSGVPPDYFSPTGQLWGNPLYRWEAHKATGFSWWLQRTHATLALFDVVRLDHFRGFAAYWEVPAGSPTAEIGRWVEGPGTSLLDAVAADIRGGDADMELPLIAEDLGVITPDVVQLRERYQLPGMRILQFGFSGAEDPFLPHNYLTRCVAYTGTHDNDTARGWLTTAPSTEREFALRYLHTTRREFVSEMVRALWASVAVYAVVPMQDLLNLGSRARMNYPSTLAGNWEWRLVASDVSESLAARLRELNSVYGR